jgi:acyl-CoA thioesterase
LSKHFPVEIPFLNWLGLEYIEAEGGRATLRLVLQKHHTNSFKVAHGGVQMTILDVAMAMAARTLFNADALDNSQPEAQQYGMVTIEMKSTFIGPIIWSEKDGGEIIAKGVVLHKTSQLAFCESEIMSSDGKILSKASGTFKAIKQRPL